MLHLAPSILLAAAVAAAQPFPARRAPDAEQKRAADGWVKDALAWTNQLTSYGEKLGSMLPPVLDGKQNGNAMRAELKRTTVLLDEKLAYFKARPSPAFAEMDAFKTGFVDYLVWENRVFVALMSDLIKIAEDRKMKRDKKEGALLKTLHAQEGEENAWKAKIQTSMKAVYAAINPP